MNPFDAERFLKAIRSPDDDKEELETRSTINLNNRHLGGKMEDTHGYDPVPQNTTTNPGHMFISNEVQSFTVGTQTITGPVNGLALRNGKIGNLLSIIDQALSQKKTLNLLTGFGKLHSQTFRIMLG